MQRTLSLPKLEYRGNEQKKMTLHLFLQILGKIRLKLTPRKNHWWYATEYIDTHGITTGPISYNSGVERFTITLDVLEHRLQVHNSDGELESFPLYSGLSVADFYQNLMKNLQKLKIAVSIRDLPYDLGIEKHFGEINEFRHYDKTFTKDLWRILLWTDDVFKEFSGRFYGKTCPVHLYWHSMDLVVTRFSGKKAPKMEKNARISDKDAYSHECISFGFWPGDENIPEPAFYSYTYPSPNGLDQEPLHPSKAIWIDNNGSPMALLKYRDLLTAGDLRATLLGFLEAAYLAGAKRADWDIEQFRVPDLNKL